MPNCQDCLHYKTRSIKSFLENGGVKSVPLANALKKKTNDKVYYCALHNTYSKSYVTPEHFEKACHVFNDMNEGEKDAPGASKNEAVD